MEREYRRTALPSGITLLTETMPGRLSFEIGVWVKSGARDEPDERLGVSHLLEHMMFKGTERRDARAIAQSLESLGGHLDAFTAREQVCFYARALGENLPEVVDVLGDIVCRSRLAEPDVAKEKSVVREEILAYEDSPEEKINDLLAEQVWGTHGLGRPILGTAETVDALTPEALREYYGHRYQPRHLLVCAVGPIEHDRLAALVERHFAPPSGDAMALSTAPPAFRPSVRHAGHDLQQLYISLGTRGVPYGDLDHHPLLVLNTLLGGGMSSRLFQSVREEAGLAYSVYSVPDFFRDAGMFSIHMGVLPERGREALRRTREELARLRDEGPDEAEVDAARRQVKGSVVMDNESLSARMHLLAHEEIYNARYLSLEQQIERILAVTRDQVTAAARRYLDPASFALTAWGLAPEGPIGADDWPTAG
ncbi:MAG: insulinase family protein [Candidatus Eisenbacteria bacterium]|uniref:Insulinase family protein n=1 Tax=Eiseniibacteriota bacterium TaxID=2212470 RepID=A0A9D6L9A3_UNCEI|nr:insulinase family protein [Candidatus Eisenbacteria bacterium]